MLLPRRDTRSSFCRKDMNLKGSGCGNPNASLDNFGDESVFILYNPAGYKDHRIIGSLASADYWFFENLMNQTPSMSRTTTPAITQTQTRSDGLGAGGRWGFGERHDNADLPHAALAIRYDLHIGCAIRHAFCQYVL